MKRFRFFALAIVVLLAMCLSFTACDSGDTGPVTYTVWVKSFSSWSSDPNFANLSDGYHKIVALTDSQFNTWRNGDYSNAAEKVWTEEQISNQLVDWGFGITEAKKAAKDLVSNRHAELGARFGSTLRCILK
jgi:hypothetical protein